MLLNSTILVKMRCNKSMSDRRAMHQERRLRILPLLVLTRLQKLKMKEWRLQDSSKKRKQESRIAAGEATVVAVRYRKVLSLPIMMHY